MTIIRDAIKPVVRHEAIPKRRSATSDWRVKAAVKGGPAPARREELTSLTVGDGALLSELTRLAQARTLSDASALASALRSKLGSESLQPVSALIDALVQGAREHERLRRLAGSDELTGIANRRSFNDALRRELARSSRDGRPVALLLLDLDGLKAINDGLGHAEGDRALRLVARSASESVRHGDLVARIGGDEFAVLLPNTELLVARNVASRIRERLVQTCDTDLVVRVSIGAAVAHGSTSRLHLIRAADAELYRDKFNRR